MNQIFIPTAYQPAILNPRQWYVRNVDEGVTAGPFRYKWQASKYLIDRNQDNGLNEIGRGRDFASVIGVTLGL